MSLDHLWSALNDFKNLLTVMTFTWVKQHVGFRTEKMKIFKALTESFKHQPLRIMLPQVDTILNGTIFKFLQLVVRIFIVELRRNY